MFFYSLYRTFGKNAFLLPRQARVDGAIETTGPGWIEGCVQGDLKTTGKLVIGKSARIIGDVYAAELVSYGSINGNVFVAGKAMFGGRACVKGDVAAGTLDIEENVVIEGAITKNGPSEAGQDTEDGPLFPDMPVAVRDTSAAVGERVVPPSPVSPPITILQEEMNATKWF